MKKPGDTIGNRTPHDLPAYNAVPYPTAPYRTPTYHYLQCDRCTYSTVSNALQWRQQTLYLLLFHIVRFKQQRMRLPHEVYDVEDTSVTWPSPFR